MIIQEITPGDSWSEEFAETVAGGWPGFTMSAGESGNQYALTEGGKAGMASTGSFGLRTARGYYNHHDLQTDSHYVDIEVDNPLYDTESSYALLDVWLRKTNVIDVGRCVKFTMGLGGPLYIYTQDGRNYTTRATVASSFVTLEAGDVLHIISRDNGFNAIFNRTRDPLLQAPMIAWTDTDKYLVYGNPDYRYAWMGQSADYGAIDYISPSVLRWEYGDLFAM